MRRQIDTMQNSSLTPKEQLSPPQALKVKHIDLSPKDNLKAALEFPVPVKRKEPKFVPYEPYKAAITPIVPSLKKAHSQDKHSSKIKHKTKTDVKLAEACIPFPLLTPQKPSAANKNLPPIIRVLREVEVPSLVKAEERSQVDINHWEAEKRSLEEELQKARNEKKEIEDQFKVQLKVNAELKKLLVASLGEDLQTRVQFLSEDKAKLAEDILHYTKMLQEEHEEMDRLSIQCDVWRSKFLACSLMVDELAQWKARLSHHFEESCEAIHWLLDEHAEMQQHIQATQKCLKLLQDTFDPLSSSQKSKKYFNTPNLLQLCRFNRETAESLGKCLLGNKTWETFLTRNKEEFNKTDALLIRTPAEEFAHRVRLVKTLPVPSNHVPCPEGTLSSLRYCRLHSHELSGGIGDSVPTVTCCRQCSGEVKVL